MPKRFFLLDRKSLGRGFTAPFWLAFFTYALFASSTFSISFVEISAVLLVLLAGYHALRHPPAQRLPAWVIAPFLAWAAVALLSALLNPEPLYNLGRASGEWRKLLPFGLLAGLAQVRSRRLLVFFGILACVFAFYGVLQFFWGFDFLPGHTLRRMDSHGNLGSWGTVYRARGHFGITIIFSSVMSMVFAFFLGLWATQRDRLRPFWGLCAGLALAGVVFSLTRGAWVASFFGALAVCLVLPRRWAFPLVSLGVLVFVLGVAGVATGYLPEKLAGAQDNPFVRRIVNATPQKNVFRVAVAQAAWEAFKENPWFGAGVDKTRALLPFIHKQFDKREPGVREFLLQHMKRWGPNGPSALNGYLQLLFTVGMLGFMAHFSIWVAVFYWNARWIRRAGEGFVFERGILWGATAALAGNLFDSLFQNNFYHANVGTLVMMMFGLSLYAGLRIEQGLREGRQG